MEKESESTTIRPAAPADMDALMTLIGAVGLFTPDEVEDLRGMLTDYFAGTGGDDHFLDHRRRSGAEGWRTTHRSD